MKAKRLTFALALLLSFGASRAFAQSAAPAPDPTPAPSETPPPEPSPAPSETAPSETPSPESESPPADLAPDQASAAPDTSAAPASASAPPAPVAPAAVAAPAAAPAAPFEEPHSASANQKAEREPEDPTDDSLEKKRERKNFILGVALDLSVPLSNTSDFIGNVSIQGFSIDLRWYAFGNIGIGFGAAFDTFSKKSVGSYEWGDVLLTGPQVRESAITPLYFKGYYAFRDVERFEPFIALGAGAARSSQRVQVGYSQFFRDAWHFAIAPEAGLHVPVGPTVLLFDLRLNYLTQSEETPAQLFGNLSFGITVQ